MAATVKALQLLLKAEQLGVDVYVQDGRLLATMPLDAAVPFMEQVAGELREHWQVVREFLETTERVQGGLR